MVRKKNNKALCLLNFSGRFGGAEKRYATLFNRLMEQQRDYYLIINSCLYSILTDSSVLKPNERIILFRDGKDFNSSAVGSKPLRKTNPKKSKLRLFLGRWKYFLKTTLLWVRFSRFFVGVIKNNRINTLYGVWQGGIWTWMWCRLLGVRLIFSVNGSGFLNTETNITRFFDSQYHVLKHANVLDFLSPSLKVDYIRRMGKKINGSCVVTPNSFIDYTHYYPVYPKKPWVVFLGRLEPIKNPMVFMEAVKEIELTHSDMEVSFYVMGTGSMLGAMQQFASQNNLKKVTFTGLHPHPWEILRVSSVFVSLQRDENYPSQSLIEAMACENAVIVTDVGDTRQLVTEKEGVLVQDDPAQVAHNIVKLLMDEDLRKQKGQCARQKVLDNHTLDRFVLWYDNLMSGAFNFS